MSTINEGYYLSERAPFFGSGGPILCFGTAFDNKTIVDSGGRLFPWGTELAEDAHELTFPHVFIAPTPAEAAIPWLPAFLATRVKLQTLTIPYLFLSTLSPDQLPKEVGCLQVKFDPLYGTRESWSNARWPQAKEFGTIRGINVRCSGGPSSAWKHLGWSQDGLPALQFLGCDINGGRNP